MERLNAILNETEEILSSPEKVFRTLNSNKAFDFDRLTQPTGTNLPAGFEIGMFVSSKSDEIRAYLPFDDVNGIALSIDKPSDFAFFNELLERSTFRILSATRYNAFKITLIDGKNHGLYLGNLAQFDDSITGGKIFKEPAEINKTLNEILGRRMNEYRFIIINNFPAGFTNESATTFIKILNTAGEAKIKVLLTKELEPPKAMSDLDASVSAKLEVISFDRNNRWISKTLSQIENIKETLTLNFGSTLTEGDMREVVEAVNLMHQAASNPASENFNINDGIKIPVGVYHNKPFYFRFGHGATNYHAIVGGRSGKGKTVFLDNIIARSTGIYSPDELRFALIDMKGIGFHDYRELAHVQAFSSSSNFENALRVVEFIQADLKKREALFTAAHAKDLVDYKNKTGHIMPRLLVVIDEFQNLFTGNYKTDAFVEDVLIKQILRIGRGYGVHLICCTQSLGDGVRSSFLNNIPLRIAFQMTGDQSRSFLAMNNSAAESLQVGEAIYNEQDGIVSENVLVKIDHLTDAAIANLLVEYDQRNVRYEPFERIIV